MRLDKYLQVSRLIKRRELAKNACLDARVSLNGREAKGGTRVKVGDRITLSSGGRFLVVEVVAVKDKVKTTEAGELYRVLEDGRGREQPG